MPPSPLPGSAGVNLAGQAGMKSKPKPTGPEVCGTAQTPNGEMASKCPLLPQASQQGFDLF